MYSALSRYYDTLMKDFDYSAYEAFLCGVVSGKKGLDLACGSGEMTVRLKARGYDMTGADLSAEMLNTAVEKAKRARFNINFLVSDLNDLHIEKRYDFVTCICDGFNYVKPQNLKKAFAEIYGCLNDGGKFVFDISSEYKLKNVLGNNLFYEDTDDLTYFWQNTLKNNQVKMELTFFEKRNDNYERFDEGQTQYIHTAADVAAALTEVGFSTKFYNEKFKESDKKSNRLIAVCSK